jgi:hypothetical protein
MHDLRAPNAYTSSFIDPIDGASAIYSILPLARERLVVGGAHHRLLKVFDIRMPGGRVYTHPAVSGLSNFRGVRKNITPGWATYLDARVGRHTCRESPVYSLAAAPASGGRLFAGVENRVWEFDFLGDSCSGKDKAAAPSCPRPSRARWGGCNYRNSVPPNPWCVMYEFVGPTKMWTQRGEERLGTSGPLGGSGVRLDGRWEEV